VRLNTIFALMEDRPDREFAFQILERRFDLHQLQIELPRLGGIGGGQVRA
jgi:hypothetical protein